MNINHPQLHHPQRWAVVASTLSFLFLPLSLAGGQAPQPLPQAHAHNDYYHQRPLLDALAAGFCNVEADIFLVQGELLVGHSRQELTADKTLESLYLQPLRERVKENGGRVFRDGPVFTLLIDIKSDGATTYRALHKLLTKYQDIISFVENGKLHQRAVVAIVSGNRAMAEIAKDTPRFVGIDGRLADLESDQPVHWMPLISDNWRNHFGWDGTGELPAKEREKLQGIIKQTHESGRRLRFWATPDKPAVWQTLRAAGVDLINTDNLAGLSTLLKETATEAPR